MKSAKNVRLIVVVFVLGLSVFMPAQADRMDSKGHPTLRIARFDVDATPPLGSHMAYQEVLGLGEMGLRARGVVLLGAGEPVVLVAVDWIAISNESQDEFRRALAAAAGTVPSRVAVHTLHQHDAPRSDFSAERIVRKAGLNPLGLEGSFSRAIIERLDKAVRESIAATQPVTHIGLGKAIVEQVASNRRILGPDGRVRAGRMSACKDRALRAEPEGTIDPEVSMVSFWNEDEPLAVLSYYATHPQSYYLTHVPGPDFPGIARFYRQLALPEALHVHFTGAAGNVAAGKYNDGSKQNRAILAGRLADGMKRAWEATVREPVHADEVSWQTEAIALPPSPEVKSMLQNMEMKMGDTVFLQGKPWYKKAGQLAWLRRCEEGKTIDIGCLSLGKARILHMPGELFVEYQLAAKAMQPNLFVAMAAYGDCGPGYIGTAIAYEQGGYEIGVSNVSAEAEKVLLDAMHKLLTAK